MTYPRDPAPSASIIPPSRVLEAELIPAARKSIAKAIAPPRHGWQPGKSGNPGGLSKLYHQVRRRFQAASEEIAASLIELALTAEDERVKSVCLIACLDRAGIRPIDHDPSLTAERPVIDVSRLTDQQRQQLRDLLAAMSPDGPKSDASEQSGALGVDESAR